MKTLILVLALLLISPNGVVDANMGPVVYSKEQIQNAIYKYAKKMRLNPVLALSIAEVESTWNPNKVRKEKKGNTVSVGLFQMYYPTAKHMGFKGASDGLKNPDVNIILGVKHLAQCQRKYGNNPRRIACCHNAGLHIRDSVCHNDDWVVHYQNKVEKAYSNYKTFKGAL